MSAETVQEQGERMKARHLIRQTERLGDAQDAIREVLADFPEGVSAVEASRLSIALSAIDSMIAEFEVVS